MYVYVIDILHCFALAVAVARLLFVNNLIWPRVGTGRTGVAVVVVVVLRVCVCVCVRAMQCVWHQRAV